MDYFCKSVNCAGYKNMACSGFECIYTAKDFYRWITNQNKEVIKQPEPVKKCRCNVLIFHKGYICRDCNRKVEVKD